MKRPLFPLMVILAMFLFPGCDEKNFSEAEFVGKTKNEILAVAFAKCERKFVTKKNQLVIVIVKPKGDLSGKIYANIEEALADQELAAASKWMVFYKFATLLSPKDYYFMVGFDGERSTTVERGSQIPH